MPKAQLNLWVVVLLLGACACSACVNWNRSQQRAQQGSQQQQQEKLAPPTSISHQAPVMIYTKSTCPYCIRAKSLFTSKGVSFEEVDLSLYPERIPEMIQRSGRRTVPQIFIGQRHIGGLDDLSALEGAGKLAPLLRPSSSK